MGPEVAERVRRPAGLWLLTIVLLTSPVLHSLALFFHKQWLNFGSHHKVAESATRAGFAASRGFFRPMDAIPRLICVS
jgi:hypothetical protein